MTLWRARKKKSKPNCRRTPALSARIKGGGGYGAQKETETRGKTATRLLLDVPCTRRQM